MPDSVLQQLNTALAQLTEKQDIKSGIMVAQTLLSYMGAKGIVTSEETLMTYLRLPNTERYDHWFQNHPHFPSSRASFALNDPRESSLEAKLYALKKKSKLFISGAVHFTPNYEDAEFTRQNPKMKVLVKLLLVKTHSVFR